MKQKTKVRLYSGSDRPVITCDVGADFVSLGWVGQAGVNIGIALVLCFFNIAIVQHEVAAGGFISTQMPRAIGVTKNILVSRGYPIPQFQFAVHDLREFPIAKILSDLFEFDDPRYPTRDNCRGR